MSRRSRLISLLARERLVIVVGADPVPNVESGFLGKYGSILHRDTDGSAAFAMSPAMVVLQIMQGERGMRGVAAKRAEGFDRQSSHLFRQAVELSFELLGSSIFRR